MKYKIILRNISRFFYDEALSWAEKIIKEDDTNYDIYELDYNSITKELKVLGTIHEVVFQECLSLISINNFKSKDLGGFSNKGSDGLIGGTIIV